jgi:Uma2 family endonuclease
MTTATQKLITAEEFSRMPDPPDGSQQELVKGVIVTMPPPGGRHGVCCLKIGRHIGNFVEDKNLGTTASNDTGFITERDPDTVRGPDISFWTRERLPDVPVTYIQIPPDLLVEVVSPSDHYARIQKRVSEYLDKEVRLIWIADPEDRSVTVYRPGQKMVVLSENETLTGEDVLPGFSCKVADLFG